VFGVLLKKLEEVLGVLSLKYPVDILLTLLALLSKTCPSREVLKSLEVFKLLDVLKLLEVLKLRDVPELLELSKLLEEIGDLSGI
jgi:hypothetical protein